ncbi:hypothetical protein [uncultured Rubinisphaera sp.]|uniref:hypothetical protein n=1 Tax=uncultured Rubinisphaera sp. TaxID=1678686 RepID=UPI0030DDAE99|tara:strand:- start:473 stop:697 length:225 start_codon:yes stop_codon:yes gene_type:complete
MAKLHPNKEISQAIEYAIEQGWKFIKSNGHVFGILHCPANNREGCKRSIFSTPRNPEAHARDILRAVSRCSHGE